MNSMDKMEDYDRLARVDEMQAKQIAELMEENALIKLKLLGKNIAVCPHCMGSTGVLIDGETCLICGSTGYMEAMK